MAMAESPLTPSPCTLLPWSAQTAIFFQKTSRDSGRARGWMGGACSLCSGSPCASGRAAGSCSACTKSSTSCSSPERCSENAAGGAAMPVPAPPPLSSARQTGRRARRASSERCLHLGDGTRCPESRPRTRTASRPAACRWWSRVGRRTEEWRRGARHRWARRRRRPAGQAARQAPRSPLAASTTPACQRVSARVSACQRVSAQASRVRACISACTRSC